MHSTELLIQNQPNSQFSHRPESNLPISPYCWVLFFSIITIYLFSSHLKDEVKSADAVYKHCSQHTRLLIQKATVSSLHRPSAPHAGHKTHRRFPLVQFHSSSSHTVRCNHLGHLVSTSGWSQISAVHFSSPLSKPAASSQPGDTPTMKQLVADQLPVSACLHTTVPGFTDLLQVLLNYLVARTRGRTRGRPLLPSPYWVSTRQATMFRNPNLPAATSQLHRVPWHLAMANTVSFAPNEQRSPCGFAERQPTAGGGSRPNTPQRPSQADRPRLLEASGLPGRLIWGSACGKAWPIPLVLGVERFLIGALKPIGICSSWPGPVAVGSPSDEGHHSSWFRIIYLACGVFSLLVFC